MQYPPEDVELEALDHLLRTRGWQLLAEHFAELRAGSIEVVMNPGTDADHREVTLRKQAGRDEVIRFAARALEDAGWMVPTMTESET